MTGDELRALIRTRGHTQDSAAEALGVNVSTVARWLVTDHLPKRIAIQVATLQPRGKLPEGSPAEVAALLPLVERLIAGDS